eukprot:1224717-Pleurochrysis_carterae.AAC.1
MTTPASGSCWPLRGKPASVMTPITCNGRRRDCGGCRKHAARRSEVACEAQLDASGHSPMQC